MIAQNERITRPVPLIAPLIAAKKMGQPLLPLKQLLITKINL
jgi:hypothetical protein